MTVATALSSILVSAPAEAQILRSTGADLVGGLDQRWQISTNGGATWSQATKVTNNPGWSDFSLWLGASTTGNGGGGNYRLRQQFTLAAGDAISFSLQCGIDNIFGGLFVNNSSSSASCPFVGLGGATAFTTANFTTGVNTLEVRWTGDNTTDGAAVRISDLSYTPANTTVPEPSTYALMAAGLAAVSIVRRRRTR